MQKGVANVRSVCALCAPELNLTKAKRSLHYSLSTAHFEVSKECLHIRN